MPGTGGTIAGVGQYVKSIKENVIVALADPEGSGLYNKVSSTRCHERLANKLSICIGEARRNV